MQHTRKRAGLLKSALLGAATLGVVSFAGAGVAQAGPTIYVGLQQSGINSGAIIDQASGAAPAGVVVGPVSYGTFSINSITANGDLLPNDEFGTTSIDTSTAGAGTITVWASETGITNPSATAASLLSGFTLNNQTGGFNNIVETTYFDTSNTKYGTGTKLKTATFFPGPAASTTPAPNAVTLPALYSITEEFVVTMNSSGTSNATITLQSVPEPGSLALLGTGLLGLGLVARRWRRKA